MLISLFIGAVPVITISVVLHIPSWALRCCCMMSCRIACGGAVCFGWRSILQGLVLGRHFGGTGESCFSPQGKDSGAGVGASRF